jgi:hypothetical protein
VTDLSIRGYNLNVYNGCLYFLDENNYMFKLDLNAPGAEPKCIAADFIYTYMIFNDKIYPSGFLNPILSMDINGSNREKQKKGNTKEYYYICGYDDKYLYAVFPYEYETKATGYGETNVQYLVRMDYEHKNKENLFKIQTDFLNHLNILNDYMIILDGYAYYKVKYNGRNEIVRNELVLNSERKIIYSVEEDEIFNITAITYDGIYIKKYRIDETGKTPHRNSQIPNIKLSLNGKLEINTNFKKEYLLFFVSQFNNRLYYIENNAIFLVK